MLYDERAVRDNIRNREGKRVFILGKNDRLTPSARDFLSREHIAILSPEEADIQQYKLQNGAILSQKPEHMTHLNGDVLVLKTHPRIAFRGAMDTLEAGLLLCQWELETLRKPLGEILELARRLLRCEVLGEPVGEFTLCGLDAQQQRKQSHFPQEYYGQPHFMPSAEDKKPILLLNWVRCLCRSAELAAARAFITNQGTAEREDLLQALNRMSSMLYILMIQEKAN